MAARPIKAEKATSSWFRCRGLEAKLGLECRPLGNPVLLCLKRLAKKLAQVVLN